MLGVCGVCVCEIRDYSCLFCCICMYGVIYGLGINVIRSVAPKDWRADVIVPLHKGKKGEN